jgi:molybdate transport system substrate-binding protein
VSARTLKTLLRATPWGAVGACLVACLAAAPAQAAEVKALTAARAVATIDPASGGSSGICLWQWFEQVGIAAQLRPKAVLVNGGLVAPKLLSGEADLVLRQISEILPVAGVTLGGPIPAPIQNYTVYAAGISAAARDAEADQALVDWLTGPRALAVLEDKGMQAP